MNRHLLRVLWAAAAAGSLSTCAVADLGPEGRGDAVCVATVRSIDTGISVPLVAKGIDKPREVIQCAVLHLDVEGSLVGDAPSEVTVLTSERALKSWGYAVWPVPERQKGTGPSAGFGPGVTAAARLGLVPPQLRDLHGFHGVFQLEKANAAGGFYLSPDGEFYEKCHAMNPKLPPSFAAQVSGVQYALSGFDDRNCRPLYATASTTFDRSLPSGLRLLDFLASDLLSAGPRKPESLGWLRNWHPLNYRNHVTNTTWIDGLPIPVLENWLQKRFCDSNLTPAQRADEDLLCLRADWGDGQAYTRLRAIVMRTEKPSKPLDLPRCADPGLVLHLAATTTSGDAVRAYFAVLERFPQSKGKTIALASQLLGKNWIADQGILECLYKLTGNEALNPSDNRGMKQDLSACRQEAQRVFRANQGN